MTTNFDRDPNKKGTNGFGQYFCDTIFSGKLVANTDTTIAVPLKSAMGQPTATTFNKFLAIITCTNSVVPANDVFVNLNAAATIPVAPVGNALNVAGGAQIDNGYMAITVKATDVLHFISAGVPNVTVRFYALQEG